MAGKAITRALLILALIVTAHMIKPFSIKSVTQHLLYSTKSFSFVLPPQLRDKFDHANHLAINLSNSLFVADEGIRDFAMVAASDVGTGPINVQPLDEVNKSAAKQRSSPKKSAPAKRVNRPEKRSSTDPVGLASLSGSFNLVARVNSADLSPVELPPVPVMEATLVPIVSPCLLKALPARMIAAAQPRPLEVLVALRKIDCENREAGRKTRIAWFEEVKGTKGVFRVVGKSRTGKDGLDGSDCEERKTEVSTEELKIEVTEPEDEVVAPNMVAPNMVPPNMNEELKASQFSEQFEKCSRVP